MTVKLLVTGFKGGTGKTTVARSLEYVVRQEDLDIQVWDGLSRLTCPVRDMMREADYAIVVEEPGVFGRLDLAFALRELRRTGTPCGVLMNKADLLDDPEMEPWLQEQQIPLLGTLPFNRYTALVLGDGKILAEEMADIAEQLKALLGRICREVKATR